MRPARRWLVLVVCALGLIVACLAYLAQWRYSELPRAFPAHELDYPVIVADEAAGSPERLRFLAESWPPGTVLTVTDARGRQASVHTVLRQGPVALALTGLGGAVFLATAIGFLAPRLGRRGMGDLFALTFLYGLSILVGGVFFPRQQPTLQTAAALVQLACLSILPAVFLHLAATFPRCELGRSRLRRLRLLVAAAAAVPFTAQAVVVLRYFQTPTLDRGRWLDPVLAAADALMVVLVVTGVVVLARRIPRLDLIRERNQVRWLLWGFGIGAAPYVFLRSLPALLGVAPLAPDAFDRVVELAIPLAMIMAVVRHQFLDIDVIIRRSLLYGLIAAVPLLAYLAVATVTGPRLGGHGAVLPWLPPLLLGLLAGLAYQPLRRGVGRWIDRTFFKLSHDRDRLLSDLDRELGPCPDPDRIAAELSRTLALALAPTQITVHLPAAPGEHAAGDAASAWSDLDRLIAAGDRLVAAPGSTSLRERESADFPIALRERGLVLAQPLSRRGRSLGVVLLGPRRNERRWVEPDLELVAGAARVAAQHLERVALAQAVVDESQARERLAELDRHKSEFLAHVAHDLRTPVAGILWSARNLQDGLAGELSPAQADYMGSIARSAEHLGRLVTNLLEVSRLERADGALMLCAVSSADVWRQALAAVQPLADAKHVRLALHGATAAAPVLADADKLAEVAINLLDNAIKYTPPGTTVTVTFGGPRPGYQDVAVRDQGPGLRTSQPSELYARFAQGDASPSSSRKGFGLGLYIAASYLERMGGTLDAHDHLDGGAVFICGLRTAPAPAAVPAGEPDHESLDPAGG